MYRKYPSGADGDFIEENFYNEKKQLISKVCYLAYDISEFGTEALEDTFYKEYTFEGKKEGFWLGEFARENYVNGKKVYARKKGNLMSLYSCFLDYLLDIPDPHLAHMYSKENGVDTVLDRFLKLLEGK